MASLTLPGPGLACRPVVKDPKRTSPRVPEESHEWRNLAAHVQHQVRRELGARLRTRIESQDVVQEVLFQVARDGGQQDAARGRFADWLASVVRNVVRNLADLHGRQRRTPTREQVLAAEHAATLEADSLAVPDAASARELQGLLARCLAQDLPRDQRTLILLRDYEALPWAEIARRTGVNSPDAARVAYARAVAELGRLIERRAHQQRS